MKLGKLKPGQAYVKCWENETQLLSVPHMAPVLTSRRMVERFRETGVYKKPVSRFDRSGGPRDHEPAGGAQDPASDG